MESEQFDMFYPEFQMKLIMSHPEFQMNLSCLINHYLVRIAFSL